MPQTAIVKSTRYGSCSIGVPGNPLIQADVPQQTTFLLCLELRGAGFLIAFKHSRSDGFRCHKIGHQSPKPKGEVNNRNKFIRPRPTRS